MLYVEDEDAVWLLFESAVKSAKIPVQLYRAIDGEEALAFLRSGLEEGQKLPNLVILDLNLPRKDGWQLLSEIRADAKLRSLSVVVFTSSALLSDMRRCLALGALAYVTKPFSYDAFLEAVNTVCSYLPAA